MSASRDDRGEEDHTGSKNKRDRECCEPRPGHINICLCGVDICASASEAASE